MDILVIDADLKCIRFSGNLGQFNKLCEMLTSKNLQNGILQNVTYVYKYLFMETEDLKCLDK